MDDLPGYVTAHPEGTLIQVFVQPRAARDALVGVHGPALKIKVMAPPLDDRANGSVERFLAGLLGIPAGAVSVVRGRASRHKAVLVTGIAPEPVAAALRVISSSAHEPG